jgi:HEAT repeat protein
LAARRGWSCYRCGALICVKHMVTTPACPSCKTLRPFTGMVAVVEGVGLEKVLQQIESDMRGGDKGPHDLLYYRKRYQAAFRASRAEIVAYCFGEGHSILPIAKLVEIGRSDLVDDDLLDRLASAPYVLGLIAVSGNEAAVRRLLAVADDPDPHTRACALSFLSAGKDATGGVREAFTRALCDPAEVNVRGLRPEDPGVSARVRAAEIADFLKPVILQKGLVTPDISIQLIAQAALQNWGIKPDLATLLNVLDASAEPDSRYVRERAVIQIQKQLKGAEPRAIREAVKRLSRAMGDTIHQQSGGETTVEAVAGSASIQRVLKKWIDHLEVADLAPLAKSRSAEIRRHAVELLNALGGPGAVGLLRQLSGDEAKAVAKEAAKTLAKLEK